MSRPAQAATLRDVASEAGVAESTASRALAGHSGIAEGTRARIVAAAEQLGYKKSNRLSSEAPDRRGLVAVVVEALHNSFFSYIVDRIHAELDILGFDAMLIVDESVSPGSRRKVRSLIDTAFDGVIVTTASIGSPAVEFLVERRIPTVLAVRSNKAGNVDVIESDNRMAGIEAAGHLLELGHREIGFILGPQDTSTSMDRYEGCLTELDAASLRPPDHRVIWGGYSHESGYSGLVQLMTTADRPTAVFCANDLIAIGALEACQKLGLAVPGDVSIIGVDDIPMAGWSIIGLTTIRQPIRQIGTRAARRVVERIKSGRQESVQNVILPTSFIRRNTTAPPGMSADRTRPGRPAGTVRTG